MVVPDPSLGATRGQPSESGHRDSRGSEHDGHADIEAQLEQFEAHFRVKLAAQRQLPPISQALPLTLLQAGLLAETARSPEANWATELFTIDSSVSTHTLRSAWVRLAQRCEILRTSFVTTADGIAQCILWPEAVEGHIDWSCASSSDAVEARRRSVAVDRACKHLLWAVTVLPDQSGKRVLALHMHRSLHDRASLDAIICDLNDELRGRPSVPRPTVKQVLATLGHAALAWPAHRRTVHKDWQIRGKEMSHRCGPWSYPNLSGTRPELISATVHSASAPISMDTRTLEALTGGSMRTSAIALIQAALGSLMADYIDQGAVIVATTLSDRARHALLKDAIFPLANLVPFMVEGGRMTEAERKQTDVKEQDSDAGRALVSEVLADLDAQWTARNSMPYVATSEVRECLDWPHDQNLFCASLIQHDAFVSSTSDREGPLNSLPSDGRTSPGQGLVVDVYKDEAGPKSITISAPSIFLSARHTRIFLSQLLAQLHNLTSAALSRPDLPLCRLAIRDEGSNLADMASSAHLISVQPPVYIDDNTASATSRHPCHWIRYWTQAHPERTAATQLIRFSDQGFPVTRSWSFLDLDSKSDHMSGVLRREYRVREGQVVALCMSRTLEAFACILGIFKAGAVYLPIAEDLPLDRKRSLVDDAGAQVVIASPHLADPFRSASLAKTLIVETLEDVATTSQDRSELGNPRLCGYLLFTSGSTGKPKGVAVSGSNLSAYLEGFAALILKHSAKTRGLLERGDARYLNLASRAFDPHLSQMFTPWRLGSCAVTGERELLLEDLAKTVQSLQITHIGILPSLLEHSGLTPELAPSLVGVAVGGEKITSSVLDVWAPATLTADTQPLLMNAYGPTEVTVGCSMAIVTKLFTSGNIGFPVGQTTAIILLPGTQTLARRGQSGELCFAGDLVADGGYLGRGPADQGGFSTFTLDGEQPTRIYRTGDMARMLDDGSLSFLGRADEQIKIRGQRLELGEVNAMVRTAASEIRGQNASSQKSLTIYAKHTGFPTPRLFSILALSETMVSDGRVEFIDCANDSTSSALAEAVTQYCTQKLPSFMVPTVVIVAAIPQLPSGKADVKKTTQSLLQTSVEIILRESKRLENGANAAQGVDLNPLQKAILSCICDLTGNDATRLGARAKPTSSIFELGIDSLSVVGLAFRLKEPPLALPITVAEILEHDTLDGLATYAKTLADSSDHRDETLWYDPESFDYLIRQDPRLSDRQAQWYRPAMPLQESLTTATMLARQEGSDNGHETNMLPYIQTFHIAPQPKKDAETILTQWRKAISAEPILRTCFPTAPHSSRLIQAVLEPESGALLEIVTMGSSPPDAHQQMIDSHSTVPPLRVYINPQTAVATVHIHHSLYDGQTLPSLFRDVYQSSEESGLVARSPSDPEDATVLASAERAQGPSALLFWKQYLSSSCLKTRPLSHAMVRGTSGFRPEKLKLVLDRTTTGSLRSAASSSAVGTTLSNLLQTLFALVLARAAASCDVVIGNVVSGRTESTGQHDTRMPCVSTIPVKHSFEASETLIDALLSSKRNIALTRRWEHTSLRALHSLLGRGHLFEVLYSYDAAARTRTSQPGYAVLDDAASSGVQRIDYPMVLNVAERGQGSLFLEVTLAFLPDAIDKTRAQTMLTQYAKLLHYVVTEPMTALSSLGIPTTPSAVPQDSPLDAEERPLTQREQQARDVLLEVTENVEKDQIQATTSFYRVGLDSLLAIRFAKQLKSKLSGFTQLTPTEVMAKGCLAALCREDMGREEAGQRRAGRSASPDGAVRPNFGSAARATQVDATAASRFEPLVPADRLEAVYDCPPLQSGMLTMSLHSTRSAYDQVHRLKLHRNVSLDRLREAWAAVIAHNDILRTTFHLDEETATWKGYVHTMVPIQWSPDGHDTTSSDQSSTRFLPRVRISLNEFKEHVAEFYIHHCLYDGASLPVIFNQLRAAYAGQDLPAAHKAFHDAAARLNSRRDAAAGIWDDMLKGYEYAPLVKGEVNESASRWRASVTAEPRIRRLDICRSLGITLHALCYQAFSKALASRALGQRDVCFGHVVDGRSGDSDGDLASEIVGPLFNTVARRVSYSDLLETNSECAERIQRDLDATVLYQSSADLRTITAKWRSANSSKHARLFDCLFVFHKAGSKPKTADPVLWDRLGDADAEEGETEYDLNVSFVETEGGHYKVSANASSHAFKTQQDLQSFLDEVVSLADDVLLHPLRLTLERPENMAKLPITIQRVSDRPDDDEDHADSLSSDEEALCRLIEEMTPDLASRGWRRPKANVLEHGIDSITAIRLVSMCRKAGGILTNVTAQRILQQRTIRAIISSARRAPQQQNEMARSGEADTNVMRQKALQKLQIDRHEFGGDDVQDVCPLLAGQEHHLDLWYKTGCRFFEAPWVLQEDDIQVPDLQFAWSRLLHTHRILQSTFVTAEHDQVVQLFLEDTWTRKSPAPPGWQVVRADTDEEAENQANTLVRHGNRNPSKLFTVPISCTAICGPRKGFIVLRIFHPMYDAFSIVRMLNDFYKLYKKQEISLQPLEYPTLARSVSSQSWSARHEQWWSSYLARSDITVINPIADASARGPQSFIRVPAAVIRLRELEERVRKAGLEGVNLSHVVILAVLQTLVGLQPELKRPIIGFYAASRSSVAAEHPAAATAAVPLLNVLPLTADTTVDARSCLERIRDDLSERIAWEQSRLRDVARTVNQGKPLFNVFLNLLWHRGDGAADQSPTSDSSATGWKHWKTEAAAEYFKSSHLLDPAETALGGDYDTSYLAEHNTFFDVRRDVANDCLSFGVKADVGMFGGEQNSANGALTALAKALAGRIEDVTAQL